MFFVQICTTNVNLYDKNLFCKMKYFTFVISK